MPILVAIDRLTGIVSIARASAAPLLHAVYILAIRSCEPTVRLFTRLDTTVPGLMPLGRRGDSIAPSIPLEFEWYLNKYLRRKCTVVLGLKVESMAADA